MTTPLSGDQLDITHGSYSATVASIGASLRQLTFNGRHLIRPFDAERLRPGYSGAILAPWPNRVAGGSYEFGGETRQLGLSEASRGHALHGLVSWANFENIRHQSSQVELATTIEPQDGYPHRVRLAVIHSLDSEGLTTTLRARHLAGDAAPFGCSSHNYLVAGDGPLNSWALQIPAKTVLDVDDSLIPVASVPVAGMDRFDFREPKVIGERMLDHAFAGLAPDTDGRVRVTLTDTTGLGVEMSWQSELGWVQVHTADLPDASRTRTGLAVEPMSCAPNAFATGEGLLVLKPGAIIERSWRISAI